MLFSDRRRYLKILAIILGAICIIGLFIYSVVKSNTDNGTKQEQIFINNKDKESDSKAPSDSTTPPEQDPDILVIDDVEYHKVTPKYSLDNGKYTIKELTEQYISKLDIQYRKDEQGRLGVEIRVPSDIDKGLLGEVKDFITYTSIVDSNDTEYVGIDRDNTHREDGSNTVILSVWFEIDTDKYDGVYLKVGNLGLGVYSSCDIKEIGVEESGVSTRAEQPAE